MSSRRQTTLSGAIALAGVGLHSGERSRVVLRPACKDHGVRMIRADLPGAAPFPAVVSHVVDTRLGTSLGADVQHIRTVEHLMSALAGCDVDNVRVEVFGPEIPALDGSARPFVEAIDSAGITCLDAPRLAARLTRLIEVRDGDRLVRLLPTEQRTWRFTISFPHPELRHQTLELSHEEYREAVAGARTFGFLENVEAMLAAGLARGGSLENARVMGPSGWLNEGEARYPDEPVRHKLLDAIGDICLLGRPLLARYEGIRAGHSLNVRAVREARNHLTLTVFPPKAPRPPRGSKNGGR